MSKRTDRLKRMREPRLFGLRASTLQDIIYVVIFLCVIIGVLKVLVPDTKGFTKVAMKAQAAEIMKGLVIPIPSVEPLPTDAPSEPWSAFINSARRVSRIYNYPANVVIAQAAVESARGGSFFARTRNNYLGIGAFDSNPDNAFAYENVEQSLVDYMLIIRRNFPEAWDNRDNPDKLLQFLEQNSQGLQYATDPDYIEKVKSQLEWRMY